MTRELPRVEVEPVVWDLDLVTVDDLLLEDTVSVTQTVAPRGVVERGETVQEAGSQTAQTTVAQSGVVLLLDNVLDTEAQTLEAR